MVLGDSLEPVVWICEPQAHNGSGSNNSGSGSSSGSGSTEASGSARGLDLAYDQAGREYRANELVLVGDARTLETVRELGLAVLAQETLPTLGTTVVRVGVPEARQAETVLAEVRAAAPEASVDLNSVYRLAGGGASAVRGTAPGRGKAWRGTVGVIDTAVDAPTLCCRARWGGRAASPPGLRRARPTAPSSPIWSPAPARGWCRPTSSRSTPGASPAASAEAMARAVDWLAGQGVTVINLSLAGPPNRAVAEVVRRAQARGVIVVAAAGNAGPAAPPAYPGAYPQVVAVTAVDRTQKIYRYANRGGYIMFAAPGVDIEAPVGGARVSGTSYASPVVAAMLARECPARTRRRRPGRSISCAGRPATWAHRAATRSTDSAS